MIPMTQNGKRAMMFSDIIRYSKEIKHFNNFIDSSIAALLPNPEGYLIAPHFIDISFVKSFSFSLFVLYKECEPILLEINPDGTVVLSSLGGYSSVEAYIVTGQTLCKS